MKAPIPRVANLLTGPGPSGGRSLRRLSAESLAAMALDLSTSSALARAGIYSQYVDT